MPIRLHHVTAHEHLNLCVRQEKVTESMYYCTQCRLSCCQPRNKHVTLSRRHYYKIFLHYVKRMQNEFGNIQYSYIQIKNTFMWICNLCILAILTRIAVTWQRSYIPILMKENGCVCVCVFFSFNISKLAVRITDTKF